ncbi:MULTISPECIES: transglycosylase domain-containing protein [Maribacter]|uniref:Transglycosylase domain-containing protein n=1 Tax=Maribacter flavus TaxID=1658664 RepID=A0ABU7IG59_9FLAO|nr:MULTISPECIES: transglycosylase domain-containing protein [Maribacter]MDC6405261.1 transglycosylase domain-containing protein [Maribacter sp. PR66]MEE1971930.1 transglycosylase domain-containing protein [Maribacter flavus]
MQKTNLLQRMKERVEHIIHRLMIQVIILLRKSKKLILSSLGFIIKHPIKFTLYLFISCLGAVLSFFLLTYFGAFGHIPTKQELKALQNPVTSTIYGKDEQPIGVFFFQNRSNIEQVELTNEIINALVATEDVRFFSHGGIDYRSYVRVLIKSVLLGQDAGGGSTITQQIAKNLFGRKKQRFLTTPINKMREIIIAKRLESIYTKDELVLLYFNTVSFGENLYGLEKAAHRFFNKSTTDLDLSESATLVGLLKAPTFYNPRNHPERAEKRRNIVLEQMIKYGYIDDSLANLAKKPLALNYQPPVKQSSFASYYKEFIRREFNKWALENPKSNGGQYDVELDGLKIYTTLNPNIQRYLENAMTRQMKRLQADMDRAWTSATVEGGKEGLVKRLLADHPQVKKLRQQGKTEAELNEFVNSIQNRKYWELGLGWVDVDQSLKDSIIKAVTRLHTGILALNSGSGEIMGYLGGFDYGFSQKDHIQEPKQVGSVFKPITYLAALNSHENACTFYDNILRKYSKFEDWTPRNADHRYGGSYSMHGALANSINTVSVELQLKTGNQNVIALAKKMGIDTEIPDVPSIVLGTAEISLFEMVKAYASLSNGGRSVTPYIIERIEQEDGTVLFTADKKNIGNRVSATENVKTLQKMMLEVTQEGTGKGFQAYGVPFNIIGKTGTTQNNSDGWFIGCSPELVIGSWVGTLDKRVQMGYGSGARTAMPMVASVFRSLSSWKRPMLTNFEFDQEHFGCPSYSELDAASAMAHYSTDSVYLKELFIKDSIIQDSINRKVFFDSIGGPIIQPDSLKLETIGSEQL